MKIVNRKMFAKQIYSVQAQETISPVNINKQTECGDEHE